MTEYISREEILDIASQYCTDDDGSCSKADVDLREMLDEIEALPAADVRPVKHGKWERLVSRQSGFHYEVGARCSCCNEYVVTVCTCEAMPFEFCPHCTADMRGDTND